jgi:hypothetical protein
VVPIYRKKRDGWGTRQLAFDCELAKSRIASAARCVPGSQWGVKMTFSSESSGEDGGDEVAEIDAGVDEAAVESKMMRRIMEGRRIY